MIGWKVLLWAAMVIAALYFLFAVKTILVPFVVAAIITALLEPIIRKLRLKGLSRGASVSIVFVLFFGSLAGLVVFSSPIIARQVAEFKVQIEIYVEKLSEQSTEENVFMRWNPSVQSRRSFIAGPIDRLLEENRTVLEKLGLPTTRRAIVQQYMEPYRTEIVRYFRSFFNGFLGLVSSLASQIFLLLLTPLLVYLMLMDLDRFKLRGASWIPKSIRSSTLGILSDIGEVFFKYMNGVAIVIFAYTITMSIVLSALMTPYSLLLALLAGALYLIPFIGAWISAAALFLVVGLSGETSNWFLHVDSQWTFAGVLMIIFIGISTLFDQLVYPRVVGKSVGLHPLLSMFVIFSGGVLFGLLGMIIAFPLAGSIKVIVERLMKLTVDDHHHDLKLPAVPLRHRSVS